MGDPFSVAGTAVGIISLGLQTCQILHKYCSEFKSFSRDVEAVQRQVRGLQGILEGLQGVKERLEIDNHAPSSQLHMALKECEETLHELRSMVDKRNTTSQPEGIHTQLRVVKERLLWPYRKEDLKEVQSSLARFQDNLALALQCAGLDGAVRQLEDLRSELKSQLQQLINMEQTLTQGTEILEMFRRDFASQSPMLSNICNELVSLNTQISEYKAFVRNENQTVVGSSSDRKLTYTSSSPSITNVSIHREDSGSLSGLPIQRHSIQTGQSCSYRCRLRRKRKTDSRRWYKIITDETYDHSRDCSRSAYGDYTRSVAVQFSMYNSLLRFCVQIGWQCSRRGGWNSPAPVLRYRAVVSDDSPVFGLLNIAHLKMYFQSSPYFGNSDVLSILSDTASQLRQTIGKGACPTDLDEHGNGILYRVLQLIVLVIGHNLNYNGAVTKFALELLDTCFRVGVPFDGEDTQGHSGFTYLVPTSIFCHQNQNPLNTSYYHVLSYLTQKLESWSIVPSDTVSEPPRMWQFGFDCVSHLLRQESLSNSLDVEDSLLEAILRRSESELITHPRSRDASVWISLLKEDIYVNALVSWTRGLGMILSNAGMHASQTFLDRFLDAAIRLPNVKSVELLLECGATVTQKTWESATYCFRDLEQRAEDQDMLLSKIYHDIASRLYHDYNAASCCKNSTRDYKQNFIVEKPVSLYHLGGLTLLSAESAWRAGHCGVNSFNNSLDSPFNGTPFWLQALTSPVYIVIENAPIELLIWLMRHGADPFWIHPTCFTTPAHVLARKQLVRVIKDIKYREDISALLHSELRDGCQCYCSRSGCPVVGCAIAKPATGWITTYEHRADQANLFKLVKNDCESLWMAAAIIRVLTFERLSLTHTCCYRIEKEIWENFERPTSEEAKEIHDLERDDIEVLEKFVAELEETWAGYRKSFTNFMNRVWRPRMQKIHQVDETTYKAELVRIGITLEDPAEQIELEEREADTDSDASWPEDSEDADSEGWYTTDEDAEEVENDKKQRT